MRMTPQQEEVEEAIHGRAARQAERLAQLAEVLGVEKILSAAALLRLYCADRMNFTDLSRIMQVSVTAGSATVWGWHDRGLVHAARPQRGSPDDQRSVVVRLLPATRMQIKKFFASEKELGHIVHEDRDS